MDGSQVCTGFPTSAAETLALMYVSQQNLRQWTPTDVANTYADAVKRIRARLDERLATENRV